MKRIQFTWLCLPLLSRHATRLLTRVPYSALEFPCLPCALATMWSLTISGWAKVKVLALASRGSQVAARERGGDCSLGYAVL